MKPDYGILEVIGVKRVQRRHVNQAVVTLSGGAGLGNFVWTVPDALADVERGDKFEVHISPLTQRG
jgi:hypothetical protein